VLLVARSAACPSGHRLARYLLIGAPPQTPANGFGAACRRRCSWLARRLALRATASLGYYFPAACWRLVGAACRRRCSWLARRLALRATASLGYYFPAACWRLVGAACRRRCSWLARRLALRATAFARLGIVQVLRTWSVLLLHSVLFN